MAYVSSNKIRVFPSVGRSNGYDIESQLTNENNLSQLVRSLCRNRKSYVLSNSLTSDQPFEFVIHGFYFKILDAANTIKAIRDSLKTPEEISDEQIGKINIWAGIKLYKNAESNNKSNSYQLLQLASDEAADGNLHELDTGKPTDNPETSKFQGIIFDRKSKNITDVLGTDGDVYTLQILGEGTSVPAKSLLNLNTTEILDGDSSDYISDKFTTKTLTTSTLNVNGLTTLSGDLSSDSKITTTSEFEGALSGSWIKNSSITTNKLGFELGVKVDSTSGDDHCTLKIKAPTIEE